MSHKQLSPHFHRQEFECPCGCGVDTVDVELLELLEAIRERFGPVYITSGYRCISQNRRIKGAQKSYHCVGQAADIKTPAAKLGDVAQWVSHAFPDRYGVIQYPAHVHVDVRSMPYRMKSEYQR